MLEVSIDLTHWYIITLLSPGRQLAEDKHTVMLLIKKRDITANEEELSAFA